MIYKTYNCKSFNIHTIKTDKFKTCHMEIMFNTKVADAEMYKYSFLVEMLTENSKKYNSRKEVIKHLEDLYKTSFYGVTTKTGNLFTTSFILDFIDPSYIQEKNYLEEVIKFSFEMIQNPNVFNEEFDLTTFRIIKERMKKDIEGVYENPVKASFREAFKTMDKNSSTALTILGTLDDIEKITPANLYETYQELYNTNTCDIYLIGALDMDNVASLIQKNFQKRVINNTTYDLYVNQTIKNKPIEKDSNGNFIQANLVMLYNLDNLTKIEKDIVFNVYNYILGSGGLTSKLYKTIREENSLCYSVSSLYLKYDKLLGIHISLDNNNVKKAILLTKKCIKSMAKGEFLDEDLENAKNNLILSLELGEDNGIVILNNYVFNELDNFPLIPERKELINNVTREDLINIAKKIKLNTTYVLKGEEQ